MHAWDMGIGERNRFAVALATTQGELGVIYIPPHTNLLIVGWSRSTHAPLSLLIPSSQTRGVVTRPSSRDHRCRPGRHPPRPCRLAPSPSRHRLPPSPSSSAPRPGAGPTAISRRPASPPLSHLLRRVSLPPETPSSSPTPVSSPARPWPQLSASTTWPAATSPPSLTATSVGSTCRRAGPPSMSGGKQQPPHRQPEALTSEP
jgi:hypothetical protein